MSQHRWRTSLSGANGYLDSTLLDVVGGSESWIDRGADVVWVANGNVVTWTSTLC